MTKKGESWWFVLAAIPIALVFPLVCTWCERQGFAFFFGSFWTLVLLSLFGAFFCWSWLSYLRKNWKTKLAVQIGWALGLWACAGVVTWLLGEQGSSKMEHHMLAGLLFGFVLPVGVQLFSDQGFNLLKPLHNHPHVERLSLKIPGGSLLEFNLTNKQRAAVWGIFNELVTRIATVRLFEPASAKTDGEGEVAYVVGNLREALSSLYKVFEVARELLKSVSPGVHGENPLEAMVVVVLNETLRPFLARWHPRLKEWEDNTGMPEYLWPLNKVCRADLEQTRKATFYLVWHLADELGLDPKTKAAMLGADPPVEKDFSLHPIEQVVEAEKAMRPPTNSARVDAGWHVLVECAGFAKIDQPDDYAAFQRRVRRLRRLSRMIRLALKKMQPTPPTIDPVGPLFQSPAKPRLNRDHGTVEFYCLDLLSTLTRHLDNWETLEEHKWLAAKNELVQVTAAIEQKGKALAEFLGVRAYDQLFRDDNPI